MKQLLVNKIRYFTTFSQKEEKILDKRCTMAINFRITSVDFFRSDSDNRRGIGRFYSTTIFLREGGHVAESLTRSVFSRAVQSTFVFNVTGEDGSINCGGEGESSPIPWHLQVAFCSKEPRLRFPPAAF